MSNRTDGVYNFDRAYRKAFWRRVVAWITQKDNELLQFDEVKSMVPMRGERYLGLREVPLRNIVGSMGRHQEFDRFFLPTGTRTRDRWINIDLAYRDQVNLPPVDLYKIGEIYFVKDGNHRVSVAREGGQIYIDAYVTEISVPVHLAPDLTLEDLEAKQAYAEFLEKTHIRELRPEADLESNRASQYVRLFEHIEVHRWYLGELRRDNVSFQEAVTSWYDNVYLPVVSLLREQDLAKEFPNYTECDLYLWVMEFLAYLREAYSEEITGEGIPGEEADEVAYEEASEHFAEEHPDLPTRKLIKVFKQTEQLDEMLLCQERAAFFRRTNLAQIRPNAQIKTEMLGQYERLLKHIEVHRWYMGERLNRPVSEEEAVISWYDNVYSPLVDIIREQRILSQFPERTETDLYLWVISRQWQLRQESNLS